MRVAPRVDRPGRPIDAAGTSGGSSECRRGRYPSSLCASTASDQCSVPTVELDVQCSGIPRVARCKREGFIVDQFGAAFPRLLALLAREGLGRRQLQDSTREVPLQPAPRCSSFAQQAHQVEEWSPGQVLARLLCHSKAPQDPSTSHAGIHGQVLFDSLPSLLNGSQLLPLVHLAQFAFGSSALARLGAERAVRQPAAARVLEHGYRVLTPGADEVCLGVLFTLARREDGLHA
mmetsp:Transcript_18767/g.54669  ORF Transcript_18767/g.54669 Transcript_18767/m.54669 type:complete len:233 (+) Transcript_18767:316-1014(+)